jgi:hypothetical protein
MQFIPSTWQVVKVDADGDAKRNPQDMDDAALATAVYLCSGKDNLSVRKGQEAAVFRYNHSQDYVNLVLRIMEAYSSGDYTAVPSGTQAGTTFSPSYSSSIDRSYKVAKQRKAREAKARANGTRGSGSNADHNGSLPGNGTAPGAGSTDGDGTDGGGTGSLPGTGGGSTGGGSNPVGDAVKDAGDAVGGVVGGVTGGGGSTPNPPSGGGGSGGGGGTAPVQELCNGVLQPVGLSCPKLPSLP